MGLNKVIVFIVILFMTTGIAYTADYSKDDLELLKLMQEKQGNNDIKSLISKSQKNNQRATIQKKDETTDSGPSPIESAYKTKSSLDVNQEIKQFGYDFFNLNYQDQQDYTNMPVGADYILGIGDSLNIYIWGKIQQKFSVAVEKDGSIFLPKSGRVSVLGLTLAKARTLIQKSLSEQFANFEVNVTLDQLRTINVYAAGEVTAPGGYRVTSVATLFHLLYTSGGPTKVGSLRNIRLIRNNATVAVIDLYDYLLYGKQFRQVPLKEGDTIFVPVIGQTVGITGSIKRPAVYELKGNESLADIIRYSGGTNASAHNQNIQLERINNNGQRVIADVKNDKAKLSMKVKDGDLIKVAAVVAAKRKVVKIIGNIKRPGEYALEDGMRLADLVKKAEGIIPHTYMYRIELDRVGPDYEYLVSNDESNKNQPNNDDNITNKLVPYNYVDKNDKKVHRIIPLNLSKILKSDANENKKLEDGDVIKVFSEKEMDPDASVYINGMVRNPGRYSIYETMKVVDLVFAAGGAKRGAYLGSIEINRAGTEKQRRIINVDIKKAMNNQSDPSNNITLLPDDYVYIKEDLEYNPQRTIVLTGQLKYPGTYILQKNETLSSVLLRAGGYQSNAFINGAVFTRKALKNNEKEINQKFRQLEEKRLLQKQVNAGLDVKQPEKKITDMIGTEEKGRIIINLKPIDQLHSSIDDISLEDGDELYIPLTPSTVQILGGVYSPGSVIVQQDMKIDSYMKKVGGVTKYAAINEIYVIKANGEVDTDKEYTPQVGDTIVVPEEIKKEFDLWKTIVDTVDVLSKVALTYTVFNSIK